MDLLHSLADALKLYGTGAALLVTWGPLLWVYLDKRSNWLRKQFLDQVNFSLNYLTDGRLLMRTLIESPARNVWLNDLGVRKVVRAAGLTTPDQPFIRLENADDMDFVYRAVLNVLSEKFAEAPLAQSLGLPIRSAVYRFAITMERYDDIRTLKMRVLLVEEKDLETLFGPTPSADRPMHFDEPHHVARIKTLRTMHDLHRRAGEPGVLKLGRVVLAVRG